MKVIALLIVFVGMLAALIYWCDQPLPQHETKTVLYAPTHTNQHYDCGVVGCGWVKQ